MTDHHQEKHAGNGIGFEREDLGGRPVYAFIISVIVAGVLIYYVLWGMFHFLDAYERKQRVAKSPLVQYEQDTRTVTPEKISQFPEPRLESSELGEYDESRIRDEQVLNTYGWVDQNAGVVHIPIDRAMQLIAERGLPTTPKAGTIPPSTVNMAKQAAAKSDTSNQTGAAAKKQAKGKSK
jgi:hypothetical protein